MQLSSLLGTKVKNHVFPFWLRPSMVLAFGSPNWNGPNLLGWSRKFVVSGMDSTPAVITKCKLQPCQETSHHNTNHLFFIYQKVTISTEVTNRQMRCFLKSYEPKSTDIENGVPFCLFFNTSLMIAMQLQLVYFATSILLFILPITRVFKSWLSASSLPYLLRFFLQYAAIGIIYQFG